MRIPGFYGCLEHTKKVCLGDYDCNPYFDNANTSAHDIMGRVTSNTAIDRMVAIGAVSIWPSGQAWWYAPTMYAPVYMLFT